jgi:hypothetical protein
MLKKCLSLALVLLLAQASVVPAFGRAGAGEKEARFAERVRAGVARLGVGPDARVKVKLRDGTKLEGHVGAVMEDRYVVADARTGAAFGVPYAQVRGVKGHNLSTKAKVAIGVGVAVAVIVVIAVVNAALDDG